MGTLSGCWDEKETSILVKRFASAFSADSVPDKDPPSTGRLVSQEAFTHNDLKLGV